MNSKSESLVAAVLTGGASRRMGRSKHDLRLEDGRRMIELVVEVCLQVTPRVVICGPQDVLPDRTHVEDRIPDQGPLGALDALLASGLGERYLVVPCDMPALVADDLRRLAEHPGELVTFRTPDGGPTASLPMLISDALAETISARLASTDRSLHGLLRTTAAVRTDGPPSERLLNINTPEEWAAWSGSRRDD